MYVFVFFSIQMSLGLFLAVGKHAPVVYMYQFQAYM